MTVVRCTELAKSYAIGDEVINAVAGVGLAVEPGEFVAIIGHSGSGKSTLLSMIGGMTRPTSGQVMVAGEDLWSGDDDYRARRRNRTFGFVFQFASLVPTLSAIDNIVLPRLFGRGGVRPDAYDKAAALLERVGLAAKHRSFPSELSGGQQRRVAIARALVNEPQVIIADEPTGDLDEQTEAEVMALLTESCRALSACLLLVTHSREIAARADRVLTMKNGGLS